MYIYCSGFVLSLLIILFGCSQKNNSSSDNNNKSTFYTCSVPSDERIDILSSKCVNVISKISIHDQSILASTGTTSRKNIGIIWDLTADSCSVVENNAIISYYLYNPFGEIWRIGGSNGIGINIDVMSESGKVMKSARIDALTIFSHYSNIAFDSIGNLWVGKVYDAGINKIDKDLNITIIQGSPQVKALNIDSMNRIWAITDTGVIKYEGGVQTNYGQECGFSIVPPPYTGHDAADLCFENNKLIWLTPGLIASDRIVLQSFEISTLKFRTYKLPDMYQDKHVLDMQADNDGNVWFSTELGGVFLFNQNNNTFQKYFTSINTIISIEIDIFGNLWLGTTQGLIKATKNGDVDFTLQPFILSPGAPSLDEYSRECIFNPIQ